MPTDNAPTPADRTALLLKMYDQMFNDINRHIVVLWQSVTVLAGAFAVFGLVEKNVLPIDYACALLVLIVVWHLAHVYDTSYWYNRNLVIIANIERHFLTQTDLAEIHYYFGQHRKNMSMLTHMRIQWWLGIGIGGLILAYHAFSRIISAPAAPSGGPRLLPYVVAVFGVFLLYLLRSSRAESYKNFLKNSPGKAVQTRGITYGPGHPAEPPTDNP